MDADGGYWHDYAGYHYAHYGHGGIDNI